jgi:hypothetical protein
VNDESITEEMDGRNGRIMLQDSYNMHEVIYYPKVDVIT